MKLILSLLNCRHGDHDQGLAVCTLRTTRDLIGILKESKVQPKAIRTMFKILERHPSISQDVSNKHLKYAIITHPETFQTCLKFQHFKAAYDSN